MQAAPIVEALDEAEHCALRGLACFERLAVAELGLHAAEGQAPVIEAVEQGPEIGDIADLTAQRIRADVLLQDGAHPLERGLPGLFAPIGLRGDAGHPPGVAEELLRAPGGDDWWIGTGQQEEEVDRAPSLQRRQQVVRVFPDAAATGRDRARIVLHRAIAAAEALRVADTLVNGL